MDEQEMQYQRNMDVRPTFEHKLKTGYVGRFLTEVKGLCSLVTSWSLPLVVAGTLLSGEYPIKADELRVSTISSSPGINGNKVRFEENGTSAGYNPVVSPSLEIYEQDGLGIKRAVRAVNPTNDSNFYAHLEYHGNIPNGTFNSIRFRFWNSASVPSPTNNFPINLNITAKIDAGNYTNVVNVPKAIIDAGLGYVDFQLPNSINAVDGQKYGSVSLRMVPYSGKFTNAQNFSINFTNWDVNGFNYSIVQQPTNGVASVNGSQLDYVANANGLDSLIYQLNYNGTNWGQRIATFFSTNVVAPNNIPTLIGVTNSIPHGIPFSGQIVGNDEDVGDDLSYRVTSMPTNASVFNLNTNTGAFDYTPRMPGRDSFSVVANDGAVDSEEANFGFDSYNIAPRAESLGFRIGQLASKSFGLKVSDENRDNLNGSLVVSPNKGNVIFDGTNAVYTPNAGAVGLDSFSYVVNDGFTNSNLANVDVEVLGANKLRLDKTLDDKFNLTFSGVPGREHVTSSSKNLRSWTPISTNYTGSDGILELNDVGSKTNRCMFFKSE
ncbi:MAG: Ig-like domain-containing protein [Nanoarchaeota archaeon]